MVIDPTSDALLKPVELDKGETCAAQPCCFRRSRRKTVHWVFL